MKTNEAGFTLIESVLILMVTAVLILIPTLSIHKMIESVQVDLFFRELSSNITLMQNHSILNDENTTVEFYPAVNGHYINFRVRLNPTHPLNKEMDFDDDLYQLVGQRYSQFSFARQTGNISHSDTRKFQTPKGLYELTYWLGSGRFAFNKISDR